MRIKRFLALLLVLVLGLSSAARAEHSAAPVQNHAALQARGDGMATQGRSEREPSFVKIDDTLLGLLPPVTRIPVESVLLAAIDAAKQMAETAAWWIKHEVYLKVFTRDALPVQDH